MAIITVIGAGNAGQGIAADCKLGGAEEVRLYEFPYFTDKVKAIEKTKRIELTGLEMGVKGFKRNGTAVVDMVTHDLAEAVKGANHILITMQAIGFEKFFKELAPLLEDGQMIGILPDNFGSTILRKVMREMGINTKVIIAGFSSQPYCVRIKDYNNFETETNVVDLTCRETCLRVDTLPSSDYEEYRKHLSEIPAFDSLEFDHAKTVIDVGFSNVNALVHVPCVLMNAGAIENWGVVDNFGSKDLYYDIYAYGCCESVGLMQWAFYEEAHKIVDAYGLDMVKEEKDVFQSRLGVIGQMFYGEDYRQPFTTSIDTSTWLPAPKGARFTLKSRYLTEDVPIGCCSFVSFARLAGVETPIIDCMIKLASVIMDTDYLKVGNNLATFGLDGMTMDEILRYLRTGER